MSKPQQVESKPQQVVSKPDWSTAPAWAQYLAMDEDGMFFWYENKPRAGEESWVVYEGRAERAGHGTWRDSLQERTAE